MVKIALATDHAGYHLKEKVKDRLQSLGHRITDFGTSSPQPVDYPDFIRPAAESVAGGECDLAVIFGGSGNGEAMTANKVKGIRCAVCWNEKSARLAKEHNNANVISIGARMVTEETALALIDAWLNAQFLGGRHLRRIEKIER
ncbi:MAG: ribose 5-phosphate isomerase B [Desulfobulbaceae bacterium]|nr:ribose 5-phosphate isomerase B [Desulfobulbaceae bacterium]